MDRGKQRARLMGYVFLEIAGKIIVTRYRRDMDGRLRILEFHDIDGNFHFDDQTATGEAGHWTGVILSSTVLRTEEGTETLCELDIL